MRNMRSVLRAAGVLLLLSGVFVLLAWFPGRMTGGGSVFTTGGVRVTHGFELHCGSEAVPAPPLPNNLEINWEGNRFHLDNLAEAICTDDPAIEPNPPNAPFDTMNGRGTGSYNGVAGARIYFMLTDAGEPGTRDKAWFLIRDRDGNVVLEVGPAFLTFGNQQAHKNE